MTWTLGVIDFLSGRAILFWSTRRSNVVAQWQQAPSPPDECNLSMCYSRGGLLNNLNGASICQRINPDCWDFVTATDWRAFHQWCFIPYIYVYIYTYQFIGRTVQVFGVLIPRGCPHRKCSFSWGTLTEEFDLKVLPTRQWGVKPARKLWASVQWTPHVRFRAVGSAVLIIRHDGDAVGNSLYLYYSLVILGKCCLGIRPLNKETISFLNLSLWL